MTIDDSQLLLQRVYHHARTRPDALYMTQPLGEGRVEEYTWRRTLDEARRMAAHLAGLDLPAGSQIAILSKNCAQFVLTDLAIWMAGHVSVALYPTLNEETVAYILDHSDSRLLFVGKLDTWDEMKGGVPDDLPKIAFDLAPPNDFDGFDDIVGRTEPIDGEPVRAADDLAILIYTSGSTGRPKGVMHDFGAMAEAAAGIAKVLQVGPSDRMLSYLPLAHAFERWIVEASSLSAGFEVYFAESLNTFVGDLQRARPTLFISVPRLWLKFQAGVFRKMPPAKLARFLKVPILRGIVSRKVLKGLGLDAVRFAGSGSAPIPGELIAWYRSLGLELLEGYGMSENFCYSHVSIPGKSRVGYVGNTYPGVECRISDEGEILVKSVADMKGYFKEPEMSKEAFTEDGFLKTGDRGELDDQGRLRITGRIKELFKTSKGKYIAPAPIENRINVDSRIELSCVSGSGQPAAFAVVQLAEEYQERVATDAALRAEIEAALTKHLDALNEELEHHEKLAFLAIATTPWTIEGGFLTPTQKIRRSRLEEVYGPMLDGWYAAKKKVLWETAPA